MEKHLISIGNIIKEFCKEHKFNGYYTSIEGTVLYNVEKELVISSNWEGSMSLDKLSKIKYNLNNRIALYLRVNNIKKELYIYTEQRSWFCDGFIIYFRDELRTAI